jgi:hypothetical protein
MFSGDLADSTRFANPRRALLRFVPFVVPPHDESGKAQRRNKNPLFVRARNAKRSRCRVSVMN